MALIAVATSCASTEGRPDGPLIDDFKIEGTDQLSQRELKNRVLTSESSWLPGWFPFFGHDDYFDPNAWTADQRRVERYYQAHGFYQAKVVEEEVTPTKEGHVAVRMKVVEGTVTKIQRFEIHGLEPLTEDQRTEVLKKLAPKEGRVFLEEEWLNTQKLLTDRLQALGYAGSSLIAEAQVDVATQQADLQVETEPGQRYKFGRTFIANPDGQVNPRLIADQVESAIVPGEWFTPEALQEAQARVFQMGVFSAVKVNRGALEQADATVPVTVDVREAPFHTWRVGGGFGADQLRNEVRGTFLFEHRNFLGGLRRMTIRAKAGYAALAGTGQSGLLAIVSVANKDPGSQHGPFGRVSLELEQPHFLHRSLGVLFAIEPSYTLEPAYRAGGASTRLGLVWRPTSKLTASLSYNFSIYQLTGPVALGAATTNFFGCGVICALSYIEQTVTWDHRDDLLEPHTGFYLSLNTQVGGTTPADTGFQPVNFFRVMPEARKYFGFFENKFVIAGRIRTGLLFSLTGADTAIPVRFFSGGNDMRGFSSRRLSPYQVLPNLDCQGLALDRQGPSCSGVGEVLPVGGNTLLDGSLELRWNVWDALTISTFVDAGWVSSGNLTIDFLRAMNVAVGIGVRYRTPIGPVRLDLAVRLPVGLPLEQVGVVRAGDHASNGGCFLGLGKGASDFYPGSPESQCAFHLSIGEAF